MVTPFQQKRKAFSAFPFVAFHFISFRFASLALWRRLANRLAKFGLNEWANCLGQLIERTRIPWPCASFDCTNIDGLIDWKAFSRLLLLLLLLLPQLLLLPLLLSLSHSLNTLLMTWPTHTHSLLVHWPACSINNIFILTLGSTFKLCIRTVAGNRIPPVAWDTGSLYPIRKPANRYQ